MQDFICKTFYNVYSTAQAQSVFEVIESVTCQRDYVQVLCCARPVSYFKPNANDLPRMVELNEYCRLLRQANPFNSIENKHIEVYGGRICNRREIYITLVDYLHDEATKQIELANDGALIKHLVERDTLNKETDGRRITFNKSFDFPIGYYCFDDDSLFDIVLSKTTIHVLREGLRHPLPQEAFHSSREHFVNI